MKYIPLEKMSKKAQKAYYKQYRGEPMPAPKIGKEVYEYKRKKEKLY